MGQNEKGGFPYYIVRFKLAGTAFEQHQCDEFPYYIVRFKPSGERT